MRGWRHAGRQAGSVQCCSARVMSSSSAACVVLGWTAGSIDRSMEPWRPHYQFTSCLAPFRPHMLPFSSAPRTQHNTMQCSTEHGSTRRSLLGSSGPHNALCSAAAPLSATTSWPPLSPLSPRVGQLTPTSLRPPRVTAAASVCTGLPRSRHSVATSADRSSASFATHSLICYIRPVLPHLSKPTWPPPFLGRRRTSSSARGICSMRRIR